MVAPHLLGRLAAAFSVPAALAVPTRASAQEPFQINVPMKCEDGITRTVTRCATNGRGGEVCAWREEKNGQLIVERFNVRGQMDGWLMPVDGSGRGSRHAAAGCCASTVAGCSCRPGGIDEPVVPRGLPAA